MRRFIKIETTLEVNNFIVKVSTEGGYLFMDDILEFLLETLGDYDCTPYDDDFNFEVVLEDNHSKANYSLECQSLFEVSLIIKKCENEGRYSLKKLWSPDGDLVDSAVLPLIKYSETDYALNNQIVAYSVETDVNDYNDDIFISSVLNNCIEYIYDAEYDDDVYYRVAKILVDYDSTVLECLANYEKDTVDATIEFIWG